MIAKNDPVLSLQMQTYLVYRTASQWAIETSRTTILNTSGAPKQTAGCSRLQMQLPPSVEANTRPCWAIGVYPPRYRALVVGLLLLIGLIPSPASAAKSAQQLDTQLLDRLADAMAKQAPESDLFDAQVWLVATDTRLQRYVKDADSRVRILRAVYTQATDKDIEPDLVLAVMHVESFFDPYAISRVGAQGLMQVMPFWRKELGRDQDNLTHIETNIRYGTTILAYYIERAEGDLVDALARYNGSRGRLKYPELVVDRWRRFWQSRTLSEQPELQSSCDKYDLKACRRR